MASATNIQAALSSGANIFNSGKTVGTAEFARLTAWFEHDYADELDGNSATANDLSAWLWRQAAGKLRQYESKIRDATNTATPVGDFTA